MTFSWRMWHFVLLWLTCDALIIQRYVKITTCTDPWVSFRLLVYTRCLFSRLLWLGGGVYNFFWRRKLMNCTNILALCVCCSIWRAGDEVVQLGEEGSQFNSVWVVGSILQSWQVWLRTGGLYGVALESQAGYPPWGISDSIGCQWWFKSSVLSDQKEWMTERPQEFKTGVNVAFPSPGFLRPPYCDPSGSTVTVTRNIKLA